MKNTDEVKDPFRSGLITAIGILLGFTLAYFTKWSGGSDPWKLHHIPSLIIFGIGIIILISSLVRAVNAEELSKEYYRRTARRMILGTKIYFLGIGIDIIFSYIILYR